MRTNIQIVELGDFLDLPLNATMATYFPSGDALLTPVWHEWLDGGFNISIAANDIKHRNLKRDPRASIMVYENGGLNRGVELRGIAQLSSDGIDTITRRITLRYLGPEKAEKYLKTLESIELVHIRLEPGRLRAWDFADEATFHPDA